MLPRLLVTELLNNSETILNVEHYRNVLWSIQLVVPRLRANR